MKGMRSSFASFFEAVFTIFNYKAVVITVLSVTATLVCHLTGFVFEIKLSLLSAAIIFPIVFTIGSAFKRREDALSYYAEMSMHAHAIYLASRNWGAPAPAAQRKQTLVILKEMMAELHLYFSTWTQNQGANTRKIYDQFDRLDRHIQSFKQHDVSPGELSRLDQYLSKIIIAFKKLKQIMTYRTPRSMRMYSRIFLMAFPILYAPDFAQSLDDHHLGFGYLFAVMHSVVFVGLLNVQNDLEQPFDGIGQDDIHIDFSEFHYITAPDAEALGLNGQAKVGQTVSTAELS
jgi:hypothetical protein